jgi:membrane protease YdiL (CAAX protease family)
MVDSLLPPMPAFGVPAWTVVLTTVAYLVVVAPIRGLRAYRRLASSRETDPMALTRFYRRNLAMKCAWLVPIALVLALEPTLHPRHLGVGWPTGPSALQDGTFTFTMVIFVAFTTVLWRDRVQSGRRLWNFARIQAMSPRTRTERGWSFLALITAALVEEPMMRGLLVAAGLSYGLSPLAVIVVTSAIFGFGHLYQGWLGVVLTGVLGAVFCLILLETGSLLYGVVLHLLINVRGFLVLAAAPRPAEHSATAAAS